MTEEKSTQTTMPEATSVPEALRLERSKAFAKTFKDTSMYIAMDSDNKEAMNVWAEEGEKAAIAHMFTDKETGRQLSYAEMRSRYG